MITITEVDNLFFIDLSSKKISFIEENNWFNEDQLVFSYTFPEELPYTIHPYFLKYKSHHLAEYPIRFEVVVNLNGELFSAKFELVDFQTNTFSFSIFYGSESFPNWDKKLTELAIERIEVADIRSHATLINTKFYPEANYYFPLIHTDQYNNSDKVYAHFKGSINLREADEFVTNNIDVENNIIYNRTIIRPYFYWYHVLKMIINQAGYELEGDVVNHQKINDVILVSGKKYEAEDRPESIDINIGLPYYTKDGFNNRYGEYGYWRYNQEVLLYGKFRLKGRVIQSGMKEVRNYEKIYLDGVKIIERAQRDDYNLDIIINTKPEGSIISFEKLDYYMLDDVFQLQLIPLELYNEDGEVINYLVDSNVIDFKLALPDTTQGSFIQTTMRWFNLDFTAKGNIVTMNFKENLLRRKREDNDWRQFEAAEPKRTTNLGDSFLIKFKDSDDEKYPLIQTYIDQDTTRTENFIVTENTTTIEIDCLPLPLEVRNNQQSAYLYKDDESGIYAVLRNNSTTDNQTLDMVQYQTPSITEDYYKIWLRFRISTIQYNWEFETRTRWLNPFNIKKEIYSYDNYHFIKKIQRDIEDNIESVSVETLILR